MAASTQVTNFKVIGTRPIRPDGVDKVTGRARFGADFAFPGMLHGKVLRSPHAHAIIKSIKIDKALELPGVKAIVTSADLPEAESKSEQAGEMMVNPRHLSMNILAHGKVLYDGHAVAAVAATSPHIAEEALRLIEIDYEVLSPVMTVDDAMKPDAEIVLADLRNKEQGDRQTNVAAHYQFKRGDLEAGFAASEYVVEREFTTAMVHQGYIEPHNAVGICNADGNATIYCSTQGIFDVRQLSAQVLGVPVGKIKVVPGEIGGGFGGKTTIYLEPLSVLLSKKTGAPVKLVMTRAEVLRATGPTSGSRIRVKMGATRDGRLVAAQIWMAYEAGAFPGSPVQMGAMTIIAPYAVENFLIDGYDVVVNRPKTAAYRAPGAANAAFASETVIDELAEMCGIDPLDFRLRNAVKEGTPQVVGPPFKRIGFIETVEAIKNSEHYKSKLTGKNRGRGVASGFWFNAGMQSSAVVNIHDDGTASVVTGSPDIGGSRASMAMIAAEVLGIPVTDVRPVIADTDSIGYNDVTAGSRVTFATGWAVYEAARDAARQLVERAAKVWEKKPDEVELRDGLLCAKGNGVPPISIKQLAPRFPRTGGPVSGRASLTARGVGPAFATACIDVEVDPETAKVQIIRCTIAQDAGRAIHPAYVEGQMQGGTAQGIGWALNEEYFYDAKGNLRNTGLLDYRMPTCLDLPKIETIIVEVPNPSHPLGVRGVGEVSIIPPPAAVANAIYHAVGVRMTETPMSPPRLLKAILKRPAAE
ncbi:MAG TPA: xanthine dehydrogenase family protein molybdopterin-binding subunit [Candidatus Binataceae bacterium]|nr:xanthine dehydrogenase family protein molybdopterin-binding subunit [Candidatus Binataceae bacterium]